MFKSSLNQFYFLVWKHNFQDIHYLHCSLIDYGFGIYSSIFCPTISSKYSPKEKYSTLPGSNYGQLLWGSDCLCTIAAKINQSTLDGFEPASLCLTLVESLTSLSNQKFVNIIPANFTFEIYLSELDLEGMRPASWGQLGSFMIENSISDEGNRHQYS